MQRPRYFAALKAMPQEQRAEYQQKLQGIDAQYPAEPPAGIKDLVDHIDYAVNLIGIDHVGIASDFDGGGGVAGWHDASETVNVTQELVSRGYSNKQIAKLWGGNLLRVMAETERVARALQK
jgi:membrane dipeptidase